jgi:hypothetical protein
MKFLATILSVLVLFLLMTVNCADCCADDLCQTEQQEAGTAPHDCPSPCSPFTLCNTCAGFVVETFDYPQIKPQEMSGDFNTYLRIIYLSPLPEDIWQPPKFV